MSFAGVYKGMRKMETQKYQQPKFSAYCKELAQAYGAYVRTTQSRAMTHDESSTSSYVSSTGKEWELYMRQYSLPRVESMLIEESKIPRISAHTPEEPLLKPVLRTTATRGSENAASPVAHQRSSRSRQLSIKTPRNQPESVDSGLYPRSMGFARIDELSEGSARKRRKKKNKLAEVYQDRGYTRLLSELRT